MNQFSLSIIQQNMRKSINVSNEIKQSFSSNPPDLLLIQEPYCIDNKVVFNLSSQIIQSPSNPETAIIIMNRLLNVKQVTKYCTSFCTTISIQTSSCSLIVANVYIRPNRMNDEHIKFLEELLSDFSLHPVILGGDFNARNRAWFDHSTNASGRKLSSFMIDSNLSIHNDRSYTCFPAAGGKSIIDLTLTNTRAHMYIHNWATKILSVDADHRAVTFTIKLLNQSFTKRPKYSTWQFNESKSDWNKYVESIKSNQRVFDIIKLKASQCHSTSDIDKVIEKITLVLKDLAYDSLEIMKPSDHTNMKSCWNNELEALKNHYHYIRNLYSRQRVHVSVYKAARNKYTHAFRKARQQQWRDFLEESESNSPFGNTYKILKNRLKNEPKDIPFIKAQNEPEIVQQASSLIDSLFPQTNERILPSPPNFNDPNYEPVDDPDIQIAIKSTSNKKAPGPDHISNRMIKLAAPVLIPILKIIFNKCLFYGYFPSEWTKGTAIILPKPNKHNYDDAKSYRPIVLTPHLAKIFEKVVKARLECFLESNSFFSPNQHGFRQGKSTESALKGITETIISKKLENQSVALITVDISGAFDNASWSIILKNLTDAHTPSHLVNIIRNYLRTRSISFHHNNHTITRFLTKGTPQGGVLSPLLWNTLLNSLLLTPLTNCKLIAYADDVSLISWAKDERQLKNQIQLSLNKIQNWCDSNKLKLSPHKTTLTYFHCKHKHDIIFNGETLKASDEVTILGVSFSDHRFLSKLNFHKHADNIMAKCTRIKFALFNLVSNCWGINSKKRIILFKTVIRTKMAYAHRIWYKFLSVNDRKKINSLQYTILRSAIHAYKTVSIPIVHIISDVLFFEHYLKWLSVDAQERPEFHISTLKIYLQNSNPLFKSFFPSLPEPFITPNFQNIQFLSGHGNFLSYRFRIKRSTTDACPCGLGVQDPVHLLFSCPKFTPNFQPSLTPSQNLTVFISSRQNFQNFNFLCKNILSKIV